MLALCFINVGLQVGIVKAKLHLCVCISKGCGVELIQQEGNTTKPLLVFALCCAPCAGGVLQFGG